MKEIQNCIENVLISKDNSLEDKTVQYLSAMPTEIAITYTLKNKLQGLFKEVYIQWKYLQPIITQYFIDNKSEIWLLFLIAHSKR